MRDTSLAQLVCAFDHVIHSADQVNVFMPERALSFKRGLAQRCQVCAHLGFAEAFDGGFPGLTDMDDVLRGDLDIVEIPAFGFRQVLQRRDTVADLIEVDRGG